MISMSIEVIFFYITEVFNRNFEMLLIVCRLIVYNKLNLNGGEYYEINRYICRKFEKI